MKKNLHFAASFPWNLALITHNAPLSVNPSIDRHIDHTSHLKRERGLFTKVIYYNIYIIQS